MKAMGVVLYQAFLAWRRDNAQELGAALAYYTMFSLGPLLVIVIAVAGLVFGADAARGEIFDQFRGLIGADGAQMLESAVRSASSPRSGVIAVVVGLIALVVGAGGVFGQLRTSLNRIWHAAPGASGWRAMLRERVLTFAMVLALGFMLMVSLVVSAGLAALAHWLNGLEIGFVAVLHAVSVVLSYAVITFMFALMFRFLPDVRIGWRDVWMGSVITAALFSIGKELISVYIARSNFGAAYGVAGSILVILVWVYYSAQIFFFGAECTEVWARRYGSGVRGAQEPALDVRPERPRRRTASRASVSS